MPNRIIREGWIDSEQIDKLSISAERFFLRLCLKADDFGRYTANPKLLKSALFPLRDDVRDTDISRDLAAAQATGLLRCYEVAGKRYLVIPKFRQRSRASTSKFPEPPDTVDDCPPSDRQASDTRQTPAHVFGDGFGDGGGSRARGPANKPTLKQTLEWLERLEAEPEFGEKPTPAEVKQAHLEFEAGADSEGFWMWGKRRVGDWRSALLARIGSNRKPTKNGESMTAKRIRLEKEEEDLSNALHYEHDRKKNPGKVERLKTVRAELEALK